MDANGGSMGKRWRRGILALGLTIDAQWPLDARFESRYVGS
ncbi:hypothetical protein LINPERPRIM_LOCUS43960 [Linum perenne]